MRAFLMTLLVGAALVAGVAHAQNYPVKAIRLVVPQPPGGGNDVIARMRRGRLG